MAREKGAGSSIVKLPSIVTLNELNATLEVSKSVGVKIAKGGEGVRFEF